MENTETIEITPGKDEGDRKNVAEGGINAFNFVRKVVTGEKVDGKRYGFDRDFILAIHKKVLSRLDFGGRLREENVGVDGLDAVSWHEVPTRFYIFSKWLKTQMREVEANPDNILLALEIAAGAHYGLTQPELHPFPLGNGRTARALVNAILMRNTDELRLHKLAVPPVPILRSYNEEQDMKYVRALRAVRETGTLNPLMSFIARRWSENLTDLLSEIKSKLGQPKNDADKKMMETLDRRKERLVNFVNGTREGNGSKVGYTIYPIPNYFDSIWLKS